MVSRDDKAVPLFYSPVNNVRKKTELGMERTNFLKSLQD
jgi:hypothetical protein